MIVDTSVIIAMLSGESEAALFYARILNADRCRMSAGSWIELTAVLVRRFPGIIKSRVDALFEELKIEISPVTSEQALLGEAAYRRYGRGTRHEADLNFGDCFAYALAKATGEPLLFKGEDFGHTDVTVALPLPR